MEVAKGKAEARIAHLRLLEVHSYSDAPRGADVVAELREAIKAYAGTPEEGLARMLLGDLLVKQGKREDGFVQYRDVIVRFPAEPYARYARLRLALALEGQNECAKAREVLGPVLDDPIWGGRAYWIRGKLNVRECRYDAAVADFATAIRTADSVWVRGQCYLELARVYTEQGWADKARDAYAAYMRFSPSREERLDVQLGIVRSLLRAKRYVEAAQAAIEVEMEVDTTAATRYTKGDAERVKTELDPIIAQCEAALPSADLAPREWMEVQ